MERWSWLESEHDCMQQWWIRSGESLLFMYDVEYDEYWLCRLSVYPILAYVMATLNIEDELFSHQVSLASGAMHGPYIT